MLINLNNQDAQKSQAAPQEKIVKSEINPNATAAVHGTIQGMLKAIHSVKEGTEKTASTSKKTASTSNANTGNLIDNMGEMMAILSEVEGLIAQLSQSRGEHDGQIDKALLAVASVNVNAAKEAYTKLIKAQEYYDSLNWFMKIIECIVAAIVSVIACAFGQPELAVMVAALTIASVSGGMSDAVKAIAQDLVKDGMSEKAANVLASVIMVVVVIAITIMSCGATSLAFGSDAAATVTENVAEDMEVEMADASTWGANTGETAAETTTSTNRLSQALNWLNKMNPLRYLPKSVNLTLLAATQSIMQTNLVTNSVNLYAQNHHLSDKEKDKLLKEMTITIDLLLSIISMAAGAGATQSASAISESSQLGQALSQFGSYISKVPNLMSALQKTLLAAMIFQAVGEANESAAQALLAQAQKEIGDDKGISGLLNFMMSQVSSDSQANQQNTNTLLSGDTQTMVSMQQSLDQELTKIAQVLAQAG